MTCRTLAKMVVAIAVLGTPVLALDAKLQTLINQRDRALSADSERLIELESQDREQRALGDLLADVTPEQRETLAELGVLDEAIQDDSAALAEDLRNAADNLDNLTREETSALASRSGEIVKQANALVNAATAVAD